MMKPILSGVAAFAMLTGVALAQDMPNDPSMPTQLAPPPPVSAYSASKTEKTIDSSGVETEKTQSYSTGINGVKSSASSQTIGPDGTPISASQEERTEAPTGASTTVTRTTTTTTGDQ